MSRFPLKQQESLQNKALHDPLWQDALERWCSDNGVRFNGYMAVKATDLAGYNFSECVVLVYDAKSYANVIVALRMLDGDFATLYTASVDENQMTSVVRGRMMFHSGTELPYLKRPYVSAGQQYLPNASQQNMQAEALNDSLWQDALESWCRNNGVEFNGYIAVKATDLAGYDLSECLVLVYDTDVATSGLRSSSAVVLRMVNGNFVMEHKTSVDSKQMSCIARSSEIFHTGTGAPFLKAPYVSESHLQLL